MPAHVALHKKGGNFFVSEFLKDLSGLNWRIPRSYASLAIFANDVAWAKVTGSEGEFINADTETAREQLSSSCKIFFRQPYDCMGKWDGSNSTLGQVDGQLYPSPNSKLLEIVDVGFRGMSGALVVSGDNRAIGMLLRRGKPIDLKVSRSPAQLPSIRNSKTSHTNERATLRDGAALNTFESSGAKQLEFDDSAFSSPEFRSLGRMIHSMERNFNARFNSMDTRFNSRFNSMDARMDSMDARMDSMGRDIAYLRDNVLVVDDLDALLNGAAMRRSLVMPFSHVQALMEDAIDVESIVGKKSPH
jgi:hypothetical protein